MPRMLQDEWRAPLGFAADLRRPVPAGEPAGPAVLVVEVGAFPGGGLAGDLREGGYAAVAVAPAELPWRESAAELLVLDMDGPSGPAALDGLAALPAAVRRRALLVSSDADSWEAESRALGCYGCVDRGLGELHLLTAVADALWQEGPRRSS